MHKIIALTGPAGTGKSYIADIMVDEFGFARIKFADPLKDMLRELLRSAGVHDAAEHSRYLEGISKEKPSVIFGGKSPRYAMQTLGTEWGRAHFGEDFWTNIAVARVLRAVADRPVVIDDCRFDNEAAAVRNIGGHVVLVRGISRTETSSGQHISEAGISGQHISEAGISGGHILTTIRNTAGYDLTRKEIDRVLRMT